MLHLFIHIYHKNILIIFHRMWKCIEWFWNHVKWPNKNILCQNINVRLKMIQLAMCASASLSKGNLWISTAVIRQTAWSTLNVNIQSLCGYSALWSHHLWSYFENLLMNLYYYLMQIIRLGRLLNLNLLSLWLKPHLFKTIC